MKNRLAMPVFLALITLTAGLMAQPPGKPASADQKPLTAEQKERLKERDRLATVVKKLRETEQTAEAIVATEKRLAIERAVLGDTHEDVVSSLWQLGELHESHEDFAAAGKVWRELLASVTKQYGDRHWRTISVRIQLKGFERRTQMNAVDLQELRRATALRNQVLRLDAQGRYRDAFPLAQQETEISRKLWGENHPRFADSLDYLGRLHTSLGLSPKAVPLLEQALAIRKEHFTSEHPTYATSLDVLAQAYIGMQDYTKAIPLMEQATELAMRNFSEDHPEYAVGLNNLSQAYLKVRLYGKALPLAKRACELAEKNASNDHLNNAAFLSNLGMVYHHLRNFSDAISAFERAREIMRKSRNENHPSHAALLHNQASLYKDLGDHAKALPLFEQALAIRKRFLPENHPNYAMNVYFLARVYQEMGDHGRALPLFHQAHELRIKYLPENNPTHANSFLHLAHAYRVKGADGKAVEFFEQARILYKKHKLPTRDPLYARSLHWLALIYKHKEDDAKAHPLFEEVIDLYNRRLPEDSPDYAAELNDLGLLYRDMGDYDKALPVFEKSLHLYRKFSLENHPYYAVGLRNVAQLHYALGQHDKAAKLYQEVMKIQRGHLERIFTGQSDRQRLDLLGQHQGTLHDYLSIVPQGTSDAQVYAQILAYKDSLFSYHIEERSTFDQLALQPLLGQLRQVRAELAHLGRSLPHTQGQRSAWVKRFDELETQKEALEARLAQESAAFRQFRQLRHVNSKQVAEVLAPGTVLVDFFAYNHGTPVPGKTLLLRRERRLLAFVLTRGCSPVCVPLGPIAPIEKAVQSWRQAVGEHKSPDPAGDELARLIWHPLRKHLAGINTVLIASDGPLWSLPFAALPGQRSGTYLIEDIAIGYVTSGRHLLELAADTERPAGSGLLAMGDLTYTLATGAPAGAGKAGWAHLPGTRIEAEHITQAFRKAFPKEREPRLLTGGSADVARAKRELTPGADNPRWRYLHLATHGYFEEPPAQVAPSGPANELLPFDDERQRRVFGRNPMLMTGLVLAGANQKDGQGILTAEEVLGLDLRGVDLVVLSACNTGLGKVISGEGVQGLQRAFQAAEARTLVTSLWRIDDAATTVLMEQFYTNLWQKKMSKLEALRQAQLFVLKNPDRVTQRRKELGAELAKRDLEVGKQAVLPNDGKIGDRSHPALWAAFVLSGDIR